MCRESTCLRSEVRSIPSMAATISGSSKRLRRIALLRRGAGLLLNLSGKDRRKLIGDSLRCHPVRELVGVPVKVVDDERLRVFAVEHAIQCQDRKPTEPCRGSESSVAGIETAAVAGLDVERHDPYWRVTAGRRAPQSVPDPGGASAQARNSHTHPPVVPAGCSARIQSYGCGRRSPGRGIG